jgi:hypothetical protein
MDDAAAATGLAALAGTLARAFEVSERACPQAHRAAIFGANERTTEPRCPVSWLVGVARLS